MGMRILLGGIPLGCDNVGDEAIIACTVGCFREMFPDAALAVSTARPEATAAQLQVEGMPLFGFDGEKSFREFTAALRDFDLFAWAGATGLSDYPAVAVRLLLRAQRAGVRTVVWNVGMNEQLNPAFYQARGRRLALLQAASRLTGGHFDAVGAYEDLLSRRIEAKLARALRGCDAVVVRDRPSHEQLCRIGYDGATVGADSAICLRSAGEERLPAVVGEWQSQAIIGVCISSQQPPADPVALSSAFDRILAADNHRRLLFMPMNPVTDLAWMRTFSAGMRLREKTRLLENCPEPEVIQAVAGRCRLVISSRLHLLVLAANAHTPFLGISRGSKVDNFLAEFGQRPVGCVEDCDQEQLTAAAEAALQAPREDFRQLSQVVHNRLEQRLREAAAAVQKAVAATAKGMG